METVSQWQLQQEEEANRPKLDKRSVTITLRVDGTAEDAEDWEYIPDSDVIRNILLEAVNWSGEPCAFRSRCAKDIKGIVHACALLQGEAHLVAAFNNMIERPKVLTH